ncbi:MAG TPA: hypothetical protein VFX98_12655 [Longimicrobiaceae bacterium]|nr:hypothetical protein [Longimicrobiaceae bacterium]
MKKILNRLGGAALAVSLAAAAGGCSGPIADVLGGVLTPAGGASNNELGGEIQYVDQRQQRIGLRLQDGRTGTVTYDSRTQVIYQQRQYPVTALEQGDYVIVRVQQDQQGNAYTDQIYVQQSVQERNGGTPTDNGGGTFGNDVQQLTGNVGQVDYNRGLFELRTNLGTTVVSMPYNPRSTDADRFRRLRNGDYVRLEGRYLSRDRFELERFL